ncbi:pirin family protein [Agriterribacter humi]|uniref:pirin family protein n=1 Tax=Agriterribacter humi TaxID=1104781 RepID=UPI001264A15A|nr:pirin family protein [Agriterribacter humi]
MANTVLHQAVTRGHADHGWLNSYHTFSFANYYNPERMHFGALRVLNDDTVAAGKGFGKHPHDNMEIISIPLEGDLEHSDSMGNKTIIRKGDIQAMSAGTGVAHSEYNANSDKPVKFLQIWVYPDRKNIQPQYSQVTLQPADRKNKLQQIVLPRSKDSDGVTVQQEAWFSLGDFEKEKQVIYEIKRKENGAYIFVLKGKVTVEGQKLDTRDGFGVWETNKVSITADSDAEVLLMDVPMNI